MTTKRVLRGALAISLAAGIVWAAYQREELDLEGLTAALSALGAWGPIIFILLFALATLLFLPGSLFALAGGALFGPIWGTFFNLLGATLGAVLAFGAARTLLGDWVRARMGPRLRSLVTGVEKEGWRFVAFLRLVPLFPFNLVNYALGLTRIRLPVYGLTTFFAMAPGALAYSYMGHVGREALAGGENLIAKGLLALGLLAAVIFLSRLLRQWRYGTQSSEPTG